MTHNPLVSVKMITYNHAPYIAQAIESVLSQKTDFPYELVIGEDCSTDGTREIVLRYAEAHPDVIRVVTSDSNLGMRANSRRTTEACRGKYIAWCEGDDYWHRDDKLQLQVDYLENHPECGLVHSDYDRLIQDTGCVVRCFNRVSDNVPPSRLSIDQIIKGGNYLYILTCTVMARRELYWRVKSSDEYLHRNPCFLSGDTQVWAELSLLAETAYLDQSLATYRVLRESASKSTDTIKTLRFGKSVHEIYLYLIDKHSLRSEQRRFQLRQWGDFAIKLAFHENDKEAALRAKKRLAGMTMEQSVYFWGTRSNLINRMMKRALPFTSKLRAVIRCGKDLLLRPDSTGRNRRCRSTRG